MASDTVLVEREAGVATVVLNRPDRMNSLTDELMVALAERLREVAADDAVRCVVLTGAGEHAFCAGMDMHTTIPAAERLVPRRLLLRQLPLHASGR